MIFKENSPGMFLIYGYSSGWGVFVRISPIEENDLFLKKSKGFRLLNFDRPPSHPEQPLFFDDYTLGGTCKKIPRNFGRIFSPPPDKNPTEKRVFEYCSKKGFGEVLHLREVFLIIEEFASSSSNLIRLEGQIRKKNI